MRKATFTVLAALCLLSLVTSAMAIEQGKGFLWNGTHWAKSSVDGKLGYIWGLSNLADEEVAGASKVKKVACLSAAIQKEMKAHTAVQIMEDVDKYYRDNPGMEKNMVLEVILRNVKLICPPEAPAGATKK
ncbi:MAG: hypothetical protein NTW80_04575 [Deltaproteobacteria bacterium]|nr:hypothetical protein [Deltaproteobacteria bacterium]